MAAPPNGMGKGMAMDPLAALAGGPAGPMATESADTMGMEPEDSDDPEKDDQIMLIEDFRTGSAEDALAAFEALLSAMNVRRGGE